jgi:hypothetical protein
MTTPQPSPRDIEQANKIVYEGWVHCPADIPVGMLRERDEWVRVAIAQALAHREAEVRAEYAAFADEHGKPTKRFPILRMKPPDGAGFSATITLLPGDSLEVWTENPNAGPGQWCNPLDPCPHSERIRVHKDWLLTALAARKETP